MAGVASIRISKAPPPACLAPAVLVTCRHVEHISDLHLSFLFLPEPKILNPSFSHFHIETLQSSLTKVVAGNLTYRSTFLVLNPSSGY